MMGVARRQRLRLVPKKCVEQFEIRLAVYFTPAGVTDVALEISEPGSDDFIFPPLHEVLGAMEVAKLAVIEKYQRED